MDSPNNFNDLINRLIQVIYTDGTGETKIKKGILTSFDSEFVWLKTYINTYAIKRSAINELKVVRAEP